METKFKVGDMVHIHHKNVGEVVAVGTGAFSGLRYAVLTEKLGP